MFRRTILAVLIASTHAVSQIRYLKNILPAADVSFENVEIGAKLFVASGDSADYLKMITAKMGNTVYTLDNLTKMTNADRTQGSITITDKLTFSTMNNETTTGKLTGFIYITTADQAEDPNFNVYVASNLFTIQCNNDNNVESTYVILNTVLENWSSKYYSPEKTAFVSNINQPEPSTLKFLRGFPSSDSVRDNAEKVIFMNPIEDEIFFDHIEPLQVSVDSWFIKAKGSFSLAIENKWEDFTDYQTTAVTTTGLIVNEFLFYETNIKFQHNPANNGQCGALVTANIMTSDYLDILFSNPTNTVAQNITGPDNSTQTLFNIAFPATKLRVLAPVFPGKFYIQYYRTDGPPLPSTQSQSTVTTMTPQQTTKSSVSTTTVVTTTQSGSAFSFLLSLIVVLVRKFVFH